MERREAGLGLAVAGCGSLPSKWAKYTHSHKLPPHGISSEHRTEGITRLGGPLSGLLTYTTTTTTTTDMRSEHAQT